MAVSKIRTVACLHPSSRPSLLSPHVQINTFASESFITVDNPPDITAFGQIRQRYNFSRCVTQPEQCQPEVEDLVQMTLEGYNSAAVFMSTGPLDPFESRQTIIHQTLSYLDEQLKYLNESRKQDGERAIRLDYAFLCFGNDNNCYDLRADRKLKKQYIDEKGLDTIMRRVNNGNDIWRITREGSRMPFVLKIRLSDDHHFLGTLTIIDLLFPWSQSSTIDDQDFAFQELVRVLNDYADVDFEGSINKSTSHLLTKITAECFCGPCKTSVFAYVNEYPDNMLRDTVDALELMQTMRRIRTVAIRNTVNTRISDLYKQQLGSLQRKYESEHSRASNLEAELNNAVQQLNVKDMDLHRVEVDEARVRHESEEAKKMMKEQLEKMEHSLELQRLKAAYEESKHVTKTVLLDGRILRLRSSLFCANYSTMKYQDDLQNAYARTKRDRETMQEQLSVIHQQGVAIQDTKDEKKAADAENERLAQVIESLNSQIEQKQNELDIQKANLDKKLSTIRRHKEALQQARQRVDEQNEILATRQSAIKVKDEHITRLRELLAKKQKQQSKLEKKAADGKELHDLELLVESLKNDLAEMEADKKALEKTIQEAEERIKWQEKTLKAQERAITKAEKQQADFKNAQAEIKRLESEKQGIMAESSSLVKESNSMQERIRELEMENRNLLNELSRASGAFNQNSHQSNMDSPKASLKESKHNMVEPAHEHDEPSLSQQSPKDPMRIDTIMIDTTDRGEEQQQQKDNNDTSMTDEAVAEDQVESESSTTKRSTKSLSRKTRQKKQQQGSSSKVTGKRRTSKRKQQPEPSPEPSLPSGVDQSPVLEYVGKDFEPVLPLPNVGDDNVDNTPLFGPPPTEHDTTNDEHHQSDAAAPSQHDTMNTQQSEGVDTQQTNQQDDIQSNVSAPSQHDIVDTQQSEGVDTQRSISMDHQQSQKPEPKKKRQTRKRRRLVDPKKRMIEDYEGDLSPLARVNRIVLQNDEQ